MGNEFKLTLRMARRLNGFTAEEVAGVLGISVEEYLGYEENTDDIPLYLLREIKSAFNMSLAALFT